VTLLIDSTSVKIEYVKMAFILGLGKKTAEQPQGRFAANLGFFIQRWGIANDLESISKCFSFGKIKNLEKYIKWDNSRVFGKIPISGFQV